VGEINSVREAAIFAQVAGPRRIHPSERVTQEVELAFRNRADPCLILIHRQLQLAHDLAQMVQRRFGVALSAQDHEVVGIDDKASAEISLDVSARWKSVNQFSRVFVGCPAVSEMSGDLETRFDYLGASAVKFPETAWIGNGTFDPRRPVDGVPCPWRPRILPPRARLLSGENWCRRLSRSAWHLRRAHYRGCGSCRKRQGISPKPSRISSRCPRSRERRSRLWSKRWFSA